MPGRSLGTDETITPASESMDVVSLRERPDRIEGCAHCERLKDFDIPQTVVDATIKGSLAIFAGAGVSTEGKGVFKITLYQDIAEELRIASGATLSFPELMSRYCKKPNGRRDLVLRIKRRFDYLKAFPEVRTQATRFHAEIATIPHIRDIFTTNWDTLFEEECGAVPLVNGEDFAFWDLPDRKVYKLHGSVQNYGSLVMTSEDYASCYRRLSTGLVGTTLKLALATKTLLFVGYNAQDDDFKRIYRLTQREMGHLQPKAYIVTLGGDMEHFRELGLTPIVADGAHFISALKKVLIKRRVSRFSLKFGSSPALITPPSPPSPA